MRKWNRILYLLTFSMMLYTAAFAQQTAYKLEPRAIPELEDGQVAMLEGTADAQGDRFYLENLNIRQPVSVTLLTQNPDHDLRLILSKYRYDETEKEGSTKGKRRLTLETRTQGEMKIQVKSPDTDRTYQLLVWVGDEVLPAMAPVIISMEDHEMDSNSDEASEGLGSPVLWVIAILLGGIMVLLGVMVFRGNR